MSQVRHQLLNLEFKLRMAAKEDFGLEVIDKKLNEAWKLLDGLVEQRLLQEAQRKDARLPANERECWTVYYPRESVWERQQWTRRTAHTVTKQHWSLPIAENSKPDTRPADGDPWKDLVYELEHHYPKFDQLKWEAHLAKIEVSWKAFIARGGAEAEAEMEAFNRISPRPECPRCHCCYEVDWKRMVARCIECGTVWDPAAGQQERRAA